MTMNKRRTTFGYVRLDDDHGTVVFLSLVVVVEGCSPCHLAQHTLCESFVDVAVLFVVYHHHHHGRSRVCSVRPSHHNHHKLRDFHSHDQCIYDQRRTNKSRIFAPIRTTWKDKKISC
jgi:hypothetical protein